MNESGLRRCILLPIDLHGINRNTLETVVRIASLLDRKVLGLLLEDMRLQQVADLPFTTEITLDSGREKSFRSASDGRARTSKHAQNQYGYAQQAGNALRLLEAC